MAQGLLSFQYEEEKSAGGMTALGGLPLYVELMAAMKIGKQIEREVALRKEQGWSNASIIETLVLLNIAGGESVDDLQQLEGDEGFVRCLKKLTQRERRKMEKRWRKSCKRGIPSPSAVFRYLSEFHEEEEEGRRQAEGLGKAFIPKANRHLEGLYRVNSRIVEYVQKQKFMKTATLDQDATLVETNKAEALYGYKHFKAYQPLNTYWSENGLLLHSEFRDGNVPAGYEQVRVLQEALEYLPAGVEKIYLRSDTAGYERKLLKYCAEGKNERFGVIEFAIGADVNPAFKQAVAEVPEREWQPVRKEAGAKWVETGQEWAEVCHVPQWAGYSKKGPGYRYIAIREKMEQLEIPGVEKAEAELPFQTLEFGEQGRYKLFGMVTNRTLPGEELIRWYRERCGKSEEAHSIMKEDLGGGRLPSGAFGANAAWWAIMVLAFNVQRVMQQLVLGGEWLTRRMKAVRFGLIHVAGRVLEHGRELIIRLSHKHPAMAIFLAGRRQMMQMAASG